MSRPYPFPSLCPESQALVNPEPSSHSNPNFQVFTSTTLIHGTEDHYVSGLNKMSADLRSSSDPEEQAFGEMLAARKDRGWGSSQAYLRDKWGCGVDGNYEPSGCTFQHPFNDASKPLTFWVLDSARRRCLIDGSQPVCPYAGQL